MFCTTVIHYTTVLIQYILTLVFIVMSAYRLLFIYREYKLPDPIRKIYDPKLSLLLRLYHLILATIL